MPGTPTQSYVFFNSLIDVDVVKVDTNINMTFNQAIESKNSMTATTILFNDFNAILDAQYFSPDGPIAGANYTVYRRTPNQTYYDFICIMRNGEYLFYDYNINNNNFYHYLCSIETETSEGPIYTIYQNRDETNELSYVETNWDEWSICDIIEGDPDENNTISYMKTGSIWRFKGNLTEEDLTQNTSVTIWDTLGKYPKISIGQKDYASGSVTCLLGDITEFTRYRYNDNEGNLVYNYTEKIDLHGRYGREIEKINAWKEFCNNGNLKLLKDVKGHSWIVQITENPSYNIDIRAHSMPTTITFDWVEIEDTAGLSIISIETEEEDTTVSNNLSLSNTVTKMRSSSVKNVNSMNGIVRRVKNKSKNKNINNN